MYILKNQGIRILPLQIIHAIQYGIDHNLDKKQRPVASPIGLGNLELARGS